MYEEPKDSGCIVSTVLNRSLRLGGLTPTWKKIREEGDGEGHVEPYVVLSRGVPVQGS